MKRTFISIMGWFLTGGEAAAEEHVEEVFRGDVGFKSPVEVEASCVGLARTAGLLPARQVVLPPLCRIAQDSVGIPNL